MGQAAVWVAGSNCMYVVQPLVVQYSRWLPVVRRSRRRAEARWLKVELLKDRVCIFRFLVICVALHDRFSWSERG